jgi:hypothetical protein
LVTAAMTAVKPTGKEEHTAAWEKERRGRRKGVNGGVLLAMLAEQKHLLSWRGKKTSVDKATWAGLASRDES